MGTPAKTSGPLPSGATAPRASTSSNGKAIVARGLSKHFRIPHHQPTTLKERAMHPFRRIPHTELRAVDNVSLDVASGEFFGIVGRNGSGKTTLLKLLAGIFQPDRGELRVAGRVSPFIELGVGFNPELAARDNVLINCTLLGLPRAEASRRFDRIIEFAELEEFVDLKLKNYSSGMHVRLAFATAIQVDADVILLDEVLAVGDVAFQEKCFDVFRRLRREGRTIVFVTHALEIVKRFCDRAMLLEDGATAAIGDPEEVVNRYRVRSADEAAQGDAPDWEDTSARQSDGSAEIVEAWFEDGEGARVESCEAGGRLVLRARVEFRRSMTNPAFGMALHNERNEAVFVANTVWQGVETPDFRAGDRAEVRLSVANHLGVGRHWGTVGVTHVDGIRIADFRAGMASVLVAGTHWTGGAADLPHEISVKRL